MNASVAIITRTKDRPRLLQRAIESVLGQTYRDWCHVIVNDGGDPSALEELVARFEERYAGRVVLVQHAVSKGMQDASNAGIAASDSTFVCVHDDDDSWDAAYLESCVRFLEEAGPESVYQGVITRTMEIRETIDAEGNPQETSRKPYLPLTEINLFRLGYENPFPPIAFCYRRRVYETIGNYDPQFSVAGDYEFNFRFLRRFEIGVIDQALAYYHIRTGRQNALGNSILTGANEHKRRYNEFKNHYLRGEDATVDPAVAVGLSAAKYLVELEWLVHEIRQRSEKIEGVSEAAAERIPTIESQLCRSLELQDAAFSHLSAKLEDPHLSEQVAAVTRDLAYLNSLAAATEERVTTVTHDLAYLNGLAAAIEERVTTALRDLAYLNSLAERHTARVEELTGHQAHALAQLAHAHEARAVDILREIQSHHAATVEARREKVLLQIGSLRLTWKKRSRPTAPDQRPQEPAETPQ